MTILDMLALGPPASTRSRPGALPTTVLGAPPHPRARKSGQPVIRDRSLANHVRAAMDASQFTDLIRRHARLIHKIAYAYCRDATEREDVVQEIAAQLWRSRVRYDERYQESTWIYRIALNVAISFQRRERRHRAGRLPGDGHLITVAAAAEVEPGEDVQLLLRCVDDLGALDKALVLLYLDGNEHASIADVLGISVSNVGTKLGRIKERLRVAFEERARSQHEEQTHAAR